jgi:replicative DNA helicase
MNPPVKQISKWLPQVEEELKMRGDVPSIPLSTLPRLNRLIWGLKPKTLVVVASRTSQFKTSWCSQIAFDFADQNIPTLFLSLEDDVEFIIERMFCNVCKVNNFDLMCGRLNRVKEIQDKWDTFKTLVSTMPLTITCGIGKDFPEVNETIEQITPKPKVVILDYIQNIARLPNQSREMLNEYIRYFRQLMVENNMCGIAVSQINRKATDEKNNEPHLHQLKETGVLEEAADMVLLLHHNYFYTYDPAQKNEFKIIVAKNKRGKCGEHIVNVYPEFYRFEEIGEQTEATPETEKIKDIFNAEVV